MIAEPSRASLLPTLSAVALLAALATGCHSPAPVAPSGPVERVDPVLPVNGIDHIIPIRFVEMVTSCAGPCRPTLADLPTLEKRIAEANFVFAPAGIQFVLGRLDVYPMPSFHNLLDDVKKNVDGNRDRAFGDIKGELAQALPLGPCMTHAPGCPWRDTDIKSERQWLIEVAIFFHPPTEMLVWVAGANNGSQGQMPWDGRSILTNQIDLTYFNFSHEVGHFLGLPHTFNGTFDSDMNTSTTLNPTTGRPIKLSDFWDLVYRPGDPPRFYSSREEAARDEPFLKPKNEMTLPGGALNCKTTDDKECLTTCDISFAQSGMRKVTTDDPLLAGITFRYPDHAPGHPSRGFNVMSYFGSVHCAGFGLAPSQILQVRRVLTYDMPNLYFKGITGGRPFLGKGPRS